MNIVDRDPALNVKLVTDPVPSTTKPKIALADRLADEAQNFLAAR